MSIMIYFKGKEGLTIVNRIGLGGTEVNINSEQKMVICGGDNPTVLFEPPLLRRPILTGHAVNVNHDGIRGLADGDFLIEIGKQKIFGKVQARDQINGTDNSVMD